MDFKNEYSWINQYLMTGESILWKGKPLTSHLISKKDGYMIPFSVVWFGFTIFWVSDAIKGQFDPFIIFGIIFILCGLYFTIGRFIHKKYIRKKTLYAITEKRIFRHMNSKTEILSLDNLPPMSIETYPDGSGRIRFDQNKQSTSDLNSIWLDEGGFIIGPINDINHVIQLIQTSQPRH
ncbi:MAG: hypothetical protein IJM23_00325 [Lachnospiraceae bacterium]|nr:hypothetical protein [Lachnospiraceae bacterium]